eukprot:1900247-Pyramimonas_sp.AAC.1
MAQEALKERKGQLQYVMKNSVCLPPGVHHDGDHLLVYDPDHPLGQRRDDDNVQQVEDRNGLAKRVEVPVDPHTLRDALQISSS